MSAGIPLIHGWQETLLCVHDSDTWINFYAQLAGWKVLHDGHLNAQHCDYLEFDPDESVREVLLGKPGAAHGQVRLLQPPGRQELIRSNARPWETGGWFDLNARVEDIATCHHEIQDRGWTGATDPVEYAFGPYTVIEWVVQGPDGVAIAMMQRLQPALEPGAAPGKFGTHFNSTQIVADFAAARSFYGEVLNFEPLVELLDEPMINVLGVPNEVAAEQRWSVAMLKPPGKPGGSIEIIGMPGLSGRDFSQRARTPQRGIIGHRFPVDNIEAVWRHLEAQGVPIRQAPTRLTMEPYGELRMLSAVGPGGALLDFYQRCFK